MSAVLRGVFFSYGKIIDADSIALAVAASISENLEQTCSIVTLQWSELLFQTGWLIGKTPYFEV